MPGNIGRGHYALPTDQIGIARGNQEGYALPESVARVLAPMMISTDAGNSLQLGSDGLLFVLSGGGGGGQPDSIDDNPQRAGSVWQPGDRLAVAAVAPGSVDEQVDAESWIADMIVNSTTLQTILNSYVSGQPDSIDDNPQRAGNVWQSGDQLAVAQPGSPDDKVDAESWVADMILNSTTINNLITTLGGGGPFDIYVDADGGDDTNDGLTPATAVQSDAGIMAVMAANGVDDGAHVVRVHVNNSAGSVLYFGPAVSFLPNGRGSVPVFLVGSGTASTSRVSVYVSGANLVCVECELYLDAQGSNVTLVSCGVSAVRVEFSDVRMGSDFRVIDPSQFGLPGGLYFVSVTGGGSVSGFGILSAGTTYPYAGAVSIQSYGSTGGYDPTELAVDVDVFVVQLTSVAMSGAAVYSGDVRVRGRVLLYFGNSHTVASLARVAGPVEIDISCGNGLTCTGPVGFDLIDRARFGVSTSDDGAVPPVSFTNSSGPVSFRAGFGSVGSIDRGDASGADGMEVVAYGGSEIVLGQSFMTSTGAFHVSSSATSPRPMFSAHEGSKVSVYIDSFTAPASSPQTLADIGPLSELYISYGFTRASYITSLALAGTGTVAPTGRVVFDPAEEYVGTPAPLSW